MIFVTWKDIVDSGQDETEVTWIDNVRFSPRVKKFDFLPRSADGDHLLLFYTLIPALILLGRFV